MIKQIFRTFFADYLPLVPPDVDPPDDPLEPPEDDPPEDEPPEDDLPEDELPDDLAGVDGAEYVLDERCGVEMFLVAGVV